MITVEEIHQLYRERLDAQGPLLNKMREIRNHVNGDTIVPLNELDRNARASVASLVSQGLEQMSTRVASTMPMPYFPAIRDGVQRSQDLARDRKRAMLTIWDQNRMKMKMRRRARHILAYSSAPVVIKPDFKTLTPRWHIRNPLDTFASPTEDVDNPVPDNVIFTFSKSAKWLYDNYGHIIDGKLRVGRVSYDTTFKLLEYVCGNELVVAVLGQETRGDERGFGGLEIMELERIPNRTGMPLAVIPQRINLDQPRGQFDGMLDAFFTRARLQALTEIAIERGIFPDEYLVARMGENPEIIQIADGKIGQLGVVKGGDIQQLQTNPGYKTDVALDRLERQERLEGAIPAEFGGESGSNIRTGRRGESILSATIDFRVQETQAIFENSLMEEDRIAIAIEKTYWGSQPKSFYIPGKASAQVRDYVPNKLWETDLHYVSYPAAGSDVNSLVVGIGQRIGIGLMSKESAREADPLIADPELEKDRIVAEGLEAALLSSIQQQAADPNGPYQPSDLAYLTKLVSTNKMSLADAIEATQKRAQERQATAAPAGSPETMPGLAMPGMGAEQPAEAAGPPGGVQALLQSLRAGGNAGAAAQPGTPGSILSLAGRLSGG